MADENDGSVSVSARIPRGVVPLVLAAVAGGGVGVGSALPQKVETQSIQACFDNAGTARNAAIESLKLSQTALDVAGQHGDEINTTNQRVTAAFARMEELRTSILERTHSRFTSLDAERAKHDQTQRDVSQDRRMDSIERDLNKLIDSHSKGNRWISSPHGEKE